MPTSSFNPADLSTDERAMFLDIGADEVWERVQAQHSSWDLYNTVVSFNDYNTVLTPAQAIAFAKLADALGKDHVVDGHAIRRAKTETERVQRVLADETSKRARAQAQAKREDEAGLAYAGLAITEVPEDQRELVSAYRARPGA